MILSNLSVANPYYFSKRMFTWKMENFKLHNKVWNRGNKIQVPEEPTYMEEVHDQGQLLRQNMEAASHQAHSRPKWRRN